MFNSFNKFKAYWDSILVNMVCYVLVPHLLTFAPDYVQQYNIRTRTSIRQPHYNYKANGGFSSYLSKITMINLVILQYLDSLTALFILNFPHITTSLSIIFHKSLHNCRWFKPVKHEAQVVHIISMSCTCGYGRKLCSVCVCVLYQMRVSKHKFTVLTF